jgi:hypothetical protein
VTFTPLEDGLDETIEWLYQEGKIELPDTVVPGEDRLPRMGTTPSGGVDDGGWEWVEAEGGEVVEEEEEEGEWEWEEVEEDEEDAEGEEPVAASVGNDDEWAWVEVEEGEEPEDDDEWEWEEVDDEDAGSDTGPEDTGRDGDNRR